MEIAGRRPSMPGTSAGVAESRRAALAAARAVACRAALAVGVVVGGLLGVAAAHAQEIAMCPGQADRALSGLAGMVRDSADGVPIPGATVIAVWEDDAGLRDRATAGVDEAGVYLLCGLPIRRPLTIQAVFTSFATPPLTVTLEPGPPAGWDFRIPIDAAVARGDAAFPGRVVGRIVDRDTKRAVEAAQVTLVGEAAPRVSDGNGRFSFEGLTPGLYRISVAHLAFEPVEQLLNVPGNRTLEVNFELSADPIELPPLVVTALREKRLEIKGFYDRKEIGENLGTGVFLTREDVQRENPMRVTHLLGRLNGIRVECRGTGARDCMIRMTGGSPSLSNRAEFGCMNANVYIDGVRVVRDNQEMPESLDNFVLPSEIAGIEVYRGPSEIPAEFGGSVGRCGAIVIWTGSGE